MLQLIKIIEKISSTFMYDVSFQDNRRHDKYWRVSKKTVFEFDYSADFLFVLSHIEFLK